MTSSVAEEERKSMKQIKDSDDSTKEGLRQANEVKKTAAAADKARLVQDKIMAKNSNTATKAAAKT